MYTYPCYPRGGWTTCRNWPFRSSHSAKLDSREWESYLGRSVGELLGGLCVCVCVVCVLFWDHWTWICIYSQFSCVMRLHVYTHSIISMIIWELLLFVHLWEPFHYYWQLWIVYTHTHTHCSIWELFHCSATGSGWIIHTLYSPENYSTAAAAQYCIAGYFRGVYIFLRISKLL